MRTLVAQHEWPTDDLGRSLGVELFHKPGDDYSAVFHIRTYEGIRVADSWHTPTIPLVSVRKLDAWREAQDRALAWWHELNGRPSKLKEHA